MATAYRVMLGLTCQGFDSGGVGRIGLPGGAARHGKIPNTPAALKALAVKLAPAGRDLRFCYEAGPCGYGIQRQLSGAGHECAVVAPSLIPRKPGERIKTDRRDAINLAKLHRAGELTPVWVPDQADEAIRDVVRARQAAVRSLRQARQQLSGFLLRHGRHYHPHRPGRSCTGVGWQALKFDQAVQVILCWRTVSRPSRQRWHGATGWRHISVGGGEIPRIDGDVAGYGPSSFCGEAAVVLATVKDARRRFAVAFGHP